MCERVLTGSQDPLGDVDARAFLRPCWPAGNMIGSRSYSWSAAKLNWSQLPTEVANMESIKNRVKKKSIVACSRSQHQPVAAVPQGFSMKMNGERRNDTAALDVTIGHLRNYLC